MKKIGLLSLALVLALGALGAAYAPWTDEVEINQVVHTGSLEIGVWGRVKLEDDWKNVAGADRSFGGEIKFWKDFEFPDQEVAVPFYDSVTISIDNLYPCVWVREDFLIGVGGTVPVHLYMDFDFDFDEGLLECLEFVWKIHHPDGETISGEGLERLGAALKDMQVHPCETIWIELGKHLLQCEGRSQDLNGSFTITVTGYQYNYTPKG